MKRQFVADIIASAFVLLFVYAGVSKLKDLENFTVQLHQSVLLTHSAWLLWWLVPLTEFVISAMLIIPSSRLSGLYLAFGLMILFGGYIIAITRYTTNVPCSCGGVLEKMTWNQHLIFNFTFIILASIGIVIYPFKPDVINEKQTGRLPTSN